MTLLRDKYLPLVNNIVLNINFNQVTHELNILISFPDVLEYLGQAEYDDFIERVREDRLFIKLFEEVRGGTTPINEKINEELKLKIRRFFRMRLQQGDKFFMTDNSPCIARFQQIKR